MSVSGINNNFLNYEQRLDDQKEVISRVFTNLRTCTTSGWGFYNGVDDYCLCGVKEYALMKKIIQQAPSSQKDFYALDIGCGNFQWSQGLADYINAQTDLPKDIKVHIIGIRGESYLGDRVVETDRCKLYNLGAFKIEELFAKFKEEGLDLENKIDLAVSRWTFRHLVDPVGTLLQLGRLLRPQTGIAALDGFYFTNQEKDRLDDQNRRLTQLFLDTRAPFLTRYYDEQYSLNQFLLRKPDSAPFQLPMSYRSISEGAASWSVGSNYITDFRREPRETDATVCCPKTTYEIVDDKKIHQWFGDQNLYRWLKENELFYAENTRLRPLHTPPVCAAVSHRDLKALEECFARGDDLYASDDLGNTPLHLATRNEEMFNRLLVKYRNLELVNAEGHTPLHLAAIHDSENDITSGRILQQLIKAGAHVNAGLTQENTPLDCAIRFRNLKGIETLIRAGAEITEKNRNALNEKAFDPLRKKRIIPQKMKEKVEEKGEPSDFLSSICTWIKEGQCVILRSNDRRSDWAMYHYPKSSNPKPGLIYVDFDPQYGLLTDDELLGILASSGYPHTAFDLEKLKKIGCAYMESYQFL